jgi:hypothetical protein
MSYKNANSYAILVAISVIALTLATAASFNHYYSASAASKRNTDSSSNSDSSSASAAASTTNPKTLSKKELNSFISCIDTANKSQGLTHKIVTNCLDTAKGITRV